MSRAVILSAVRTPVGRYGGALSSVRPDDLAGLAIAAAVERAGVPPAEIEDVHFGCANQAGEDNRNVARMAALLAGLPESVAGVTVNRLCASGLAAVVSACHAVAAGDGDLFVAGGRRVDEQSAAGNVEAGYGVSAREPGRLRHGARLALSEPEAGGDVPARVDGRDGRERRRALGRLAGRSGRVRARVAAALGGGERSRALRRRARRCRRRRARRAPAAGHERRAARAAQARVPRKRDGDRRQRERHQRRRRRARGRERGARADARGRAAGRVRRRAPSPESIRA